MPHATNTDSTAAVGVTRVQFLVEQSLGWIFRRQEHRDTGIDAQVEVVLSGEATGLVLALQIKTGPSYFTEKTSKGWRYRGNYSHLRYWNEHNLPVIVVLVDDTTGKAYWALVGEDAEIHRAEKSWTIEIPRSQQVGVNCAGAWMDLAWAANPRDALYRYCVAHRRYIQHISNGGRVLVEADDWINKTRGQAEFRVNLEDENGTVVETQAWSFFAGIHDVHDFVRHVFPWADVGIDEDFYGMHEDVPPEAVFQDSESPGGYYIIPGERPTGIRPYADSAGEVEHYRFELFLNNTGLAFASLAANAASTTTYPPYYLARVLSRE